MLVRASSRKLYQFSSPLHDRNTIRFVPTQSLTSANFLPSFFIFSLTSFYHSSCSVWADQAAKTSAVQQFPYDPSMLSGQLINALKNLTTVRPPPSKSDLLPFITALTNKSIRFSAEECVNVLQSVKMLNIRDLSLRTLLFRRINNTIHSFSFDEIILLLKTLNNHFWKEDETTKLIARCVSERVEEINVYALVELLNVFIKMSFFPKNVFQAMRGRVVALAPELRPLEVCVVLRAYMENGEYFIDVQNALFAHAQKNISLYKSRDISTVFRVMMQFGSYDQKLVSSLCVEAKKKANDFLPIEIAMMLRCMSYFEVFEMDCFEALCAQALKEIKNFKLQDVLYVLSALAKFQYYDLHLIEALCEQAKKHEVRMPVDIAHMLGDLTTLGLTQQKELAQRLVKGIILPLVEYHVLEICLILDAIRMYDLYDQRLVEALCQTAFSRPESDFSLSKCVRLLHSLVGLRYQHEALQSKIKAILLSTPTFELKPRRLTQLLCALSHFGIHDRVLIDRICAKALLCLDSFEARDAASALCVLRTMNYSSETVINNLTKIVSLSLTQCVDNVREI